MRTWAIVIAGLALVATTGVLVHRYDAAQHERVVADLRAEAAATLAEATGKVLARERAATAQLAQLEDAYAHLAEDRAAAAVESERLSADLRGALERLRRAGAGRSGGGAGLPAAAAGTERCADLRAARDRAAAALELLVVEGRQAAVDGQHAVDVATIAAQAARTSEAGR